MAVGEEILREPGGFYGNVMIAIEEEIAAGDAVFLLDEGESVAEGLPGPFFRRAAQRLGRRIVSSHSFG